MKKVTVILMSVFAFIALSLNAGNAHQFSGDKEVAKQNNAKSKRVVKGKKGKGGFILSYIDGETLGECFGYEVHAKKNTKQYLEKVGFYYSESDNQMMDMKFRLNVYDMSKVTKSPSSDFVNVLTEPIYFDYKIDAPGTGKFEFVLPAPILLPTDAMVEIEMLENLNDKRFWYKSNLVGKKNWMRSLNDGEWLQSPFASPIFIICRELKE